MYSVIVIIFCLLQLLGLMSEYTRLPSPGRHRFYSTAGNGHCNSGGDVTCHVIGALTAISGR